MQCDRYRNYCALQCILLEGVEVLKERGVMTMQNFLLDFRATVLEDQNVARFRSQNVQKRTVLEHGKGEALCRTLRNCEGAWQDLSLVQEYCASQVEM